MQCQYVYDAAKLWLMSRDGVPFTYDNNGNLKTIANGASVFTYTPDNMLASATVVGGVRTYSVRRRQLAHQATDAAGQQLLPAWPPG